jgi:hypothetical protein
MLIDPTASLEAPLGRIRLLRWTAIGIFAAGLAPLLGDSNAMRAIRVLTNPAPPPAVQNSSTTAAARICANEALPMKELIPVNCRRRGVRMLPA